MFRDGTEATRADRVAAITNPQIFFRLSIVGVAGAGPPMVFRRAPTTDGLKIRGYVSTFVVLIPAPVPRTTRVPTT